jgi:hypothetical protein
MLARQMKKHWRDSPEWRTRHALMQSPERKNRTHGQISSTRPPARSAQGQQCAPQSGLCTRGGGQAGAGGPFAHAHDAKASQSNQAHDDWSSFQASNPVRTCASRIHTRTASRARVPPCSYTAWPSFCASASLAAAACTRWRAWSSCGAPFP